MTLARSSGESELARPHEALTWLHAVASTQIGSGTDLLDEASSRVYPNSSATHEHAGPQAIAPDVMMSEVAEDSTPPARLPDEVDRPRHESRRHHRRAGRSRSRHARVQDSPRSDSDTSSSPSPSGPPPSNDDADEPLRDGASTPGRDGAEPSAAAPQFGAAAPNRRRRVLSVCHPFALVTACAKRHVVERGKNDCFDQSFHASFPHAPRTAAEMAAYRRALDIPVGTMLDSRHQRAMADSQDVGLILLDPGNMRVVYHPPDLLQRPDHRAVVIIRDSEQHVVAFAPHGKSGTSSVELMVQWLASLPMEHQPNWVNDNSESYGSAPGGSTSPDLSSDDMVPQSQVPDDIAPTVARAAYAISHLGRDAPPEPEPSTPTDVHAGGTPHVAIDISHMGGDDPPQPGTQADVVGSTPQPRDQGG